MGFCNAEIWLVSQHGKKYANCNKIKGDFILLQLKVSSLDVLILLFFRLDLYVDQILQEHPNLINAYSGDKYIPKEYLEGSIEQRFDLLSGLLDTDGSVGDKGRISFTTTSKTMAENVVVLCRSLGFIPTMFQDKRTEKYTTGCCFTVTVKGKPELKAKLFRYSVKRNKLEEYLNTPMRRESNGNNPIVEIIETNNYVEMTCFLVDNEEHLFLMNDYIVTHNTKAAIGDLCYTSAIEMWSDEEEDFVPNPNIKVVASIFWIVFMYAISNRPTKSPLLHFIKCRFISLSVIFPSMLSYLTRVTFA